MINKQQIKGILFDMDGLILDTEKLYCRFWQEAARILGYPMTMEQALGMRSLNRHAGEAKLKSYFGEGISYTEVREKRIELMDAFVEKEGVTTKPGIWELLAFLQEKQIKYLSSVHLENEFDAIVSGYMVEHGKPEPDIYVYAARQLGLEPENCIVLEDSPAGILAAYRAGCMPVMIPDLDEPDEETRKLLFAQAESLVQFREVLEKSG